MLDRDTSCVSGIYGEPAFAIFDKLQFFIEHNVTPQSSDAAGYIEGLHELLHPARSTVKNNAPPPPYRSASSNNHLKHQVCLDKISRPFLAVFYHLRGLTESQIGFLGFLRPMMSVPTVPLWSALADLLGLKKVRKLWVLQLLILVDSNSAPKERGGLSSLTGSIASALLYLVVYVHHICTAPVGISQRTCILLVDCTSV
jgi:hypothetical protein